MNYYQHHIGDFNSATRHLTLVERALYRDLIEMYYDTEQAIDASDFERLARRLLCRTEDEKTALQYVLSEFFTLEGDHYYQSRCEREIAEYQAKREQQVKAGKASAAKRASVNKANTGDSTNDTSTTVEPKSNDRSTNHKPLTNNQEPVSSSGSNACEENFKPQQNVIAGYAIYHTQDTNLYSLIELEKKYPSLQQDFIEQAKASYQTITLSTSQYVDLMGRLRQWSLTKSIGQTPQKWINSWLNIVKNNAHEVVKPVKTTSVRKERHRYGTGVIPTNSSQIRDVGDC